MEFSPIHFEPQFLSENPFAKKINLYNGFKPLEFQQCSIANVVNENRPSSPMRGLTENLNHLFLNHQGTEDINIPKPQIPDLFARMRNTRMPLGEISPGQLNANSLNANMPALNFNHNQAPPTANPLESLKHLDNFYMNYSNSPLSGGAGMFKECSDSGSRKYYQKEFDSFTDMVSAFQSHKTNLDETKEELLIPRLRMLNSAQLLHNKIEGVKNREEVTDLSGIRENIPFENFKSFVEAERFSFKKTSCFSNLVYSQNTEISPANICNN